MELAPSPRLAAAIVALHAAAAACAALVLPGGAGVLLAAAFLALGLAAAWSRALLGSRNSVRAIELGEAGATLELAGGERLPAQLGPRTLLVTADMLSDDSFRSLRIWALWGRLPGVAAKQLPA
jgi:hypothetical protein